MKVIIIWYKHKEIKVFENKLSNFDLWVQYSLFSFTTQKKAFPEIPIWSSKYGLFWEVVDVVRRCTKWKYNKKWSHMNPTETLDAIRKFRWISSIDHEFWLSTIITYSTFKNFNLLRTPPLWLRTPPFHSLRTPYVMPLRTPLRTPGGVREKKHAWG